MADGIRDWLKNFDLEKYTDSFVGDDVGLDVLAYLTEDHLRELGVSVGDRIRLLKAIEAEGSRRVEAVAAIIPGPVETTPTTPRATGEAERRQLTVMFCDLADSTELSTRLDPEDMQDVIRAYQDSVTNAVQHFDGYVAKFMGDGVLVYFGYPQAHEDDTERAVRASLDVIASMADLNTQVGDQHGVELAVRIGIATGQVVVGDIVGEGAAEEAAVIGETPNLAARLQAIAEPNQVIVSEATQRLLSDLFEYDDLGTHELKGIATPAQVWRVTREIDIDSLHDEKHALGDAPLVGRQEELGLLIRSWETSTQGRGQVVLLQGEAGIGKSRLVDALREHVSKMPHTWVSIRCSPYHTNSMLYPVIEHMKRVMGWTQDDDPARKFDKLEAAVAMQSLPPEEAVPLFASLMSVPLPAERYKPLELSPAQTREQILDALVGWLFDEAERRPVLQVWEDLHWADPTTLEFAELYIEQSPTVSMLNLLTYRPEFTPPWAMRSHMTPITLNRMEQPEVETLLLNHAGSKRLPPEVVEHIIEKADGVPLYVEELTKSILESDYLIEESDRYTLAGAFSDAVIPASLQDSLMARLDRLPALREVAQMGAVLGREFAYEMLRGVAGLDEPQLQNGLEQLVADELLYQRGRFPRSRYIFKHALIQDAAYQSLLNRTRQNCHQRVAQLLEEQFQDSVEAHPELAAHHYAEAGDQERAAFYWRKAGERSRGQSANLEAIAYLTNGIEALQDLPETQERGQLELSLQLSLGHANIVTKGHGSAAAETAYARALALCDKLGDVPELAPTLFGHWRFCVGARPLDETHEVASKISRLATRKGDTELEVIADYALGYTALCRGQLGEASQYLDSGLAQYSSAQRTAEIYRAAQDPGVACGAYLALTEWLLGQPAAARNRWEQGIQLAEELEDPFSLAYALCYVGAIISEASGGDTKAIVSRGLDVAIDGGFSLWIAYGKVQQSYLRFQTQPGDSALDNLRDSVTEISDMGVQINRPYYMSLLAKAYLQAERIDDGLKILDHALASVDIRGECWWEAEVLRLRGELLLARPAANGDDAQACFEQALAVSRNQEAKSLEFRSAKSLARLWQSQAKTSDAHDLLKPIYDWFAEGFDTPDLIDAKALLDELS